MKTSKIFNLLFAISVLLLTGCNGEIQQLEKATIFSVADNGQSIVLDGVINSSAFDAFKTLAEENPTIKQITIVNCDGSINDEVNLKLATYVHENEFDIHLNDNGLVASGGTDFFLAGKKRTKGIDTKIGVHSWAGDGEKVATDFPKGHKNHQPYIDYYKAIGFSPEQAEDFYYFTINQAPAEGMHWMTDVELAKYGFLTN